MLNFLGKKTTKFLLATTFFALIGGGQVFAKNDKNTLVKEEDGYYYGYGKADTAEEAEFIAKKDLIESALTSTLRITNPKASRVSVADSTVNTRLTKIKPFAQNKPGTDVTYRIKVADWEKNEKTFEDNLRSSLTGAYNNITTGKNLASKIDDASKILNELSANGVRDLLTLQEEGTELFSKKVESICTNIVDSLAITISAANGIVSSETAYNISVKDEDGNAVSALKLKASWDVAELPITVDYGEIASVVSMIETDKAGNAAVDFPVSEDFKNRPISLTVSTTFSNSEYVYSALRKLDARSSAEGLYIYYENPAETFKGVVVEAGEYDCGAVSQDTKAGKKEEARKATLSSYEVSITPVTNAQYAAYLFITESDQTPKYFDNPDYNQANQPLVGVTFEEAQAYAEWLSEQTGETYRLPSDDEWEVAARAGAATIYPWGDENPSKGKKANYKGNGKFKTPSPVGSFEEAVNAWGLVDMSGNVWEWTSSTRNIEDEETTERTVKGGSWMDGPVELRVSNYKNVESGNSYPDVGFRLVKELNNEEE